jgi:hypothetical protein
MVILVKIGQLQMPVESREPIINSGFFHLKRSFIKLNKKKLHMEGFCRGLSSQKCLSDHGKIVTKYAVAGRVQPKKIFSSQNHIEKLLLDDFRPLLVFWSESSLFRL